MVIDIFQKHASSLLDRSSERVLRAGRNWVEDQLGGQDTARALTRLAGEYLNAEWNASSELNGLIDKILGINTSDGVTDRPFSLGGSIPILNMVDDNGKIPTIVITARDSVESGDSTSERNNPTYSKTMSREKRLLRNQIILPIPNQLVNNRSFAWEGGSTKSVGSEVYTAFADKEVSIDGFSQGVKQLSNSGAGDRVTELLKSAAIKTFLGDAAGNKRDFDRKQIVNDGKRMMFKGTDFRTFQFEFDLVPKNASDVVYMMALTKVLEYHASPDLGAKAVMIRYPSTWDIEFKNAEGGDLDLMLNLKPCVVSSLSFNYTPDGLWRTFKTGHPIHMKVSIGFTETELIYKSGMTDKGNIKI